MTTGSSMLAITLTAPPHSRHVSMSISSGPAVDPSGLLPLDPTSDSYARHSAPTALGAPESGPRVAQWYVGKLGEFVACWRLDPTKPQG
jgi:hypothetical protein